MNQPNLWMQDRLCMDRDALQRAIQAAATIDEEDLDAAAIELVECYLPAAYRHLNDCRTYADNFEALRYLEWDGQLDKDVDECIVPTLDRHDVYFALAHWDCRVAAEMFSGSSLSPDWRSEDQVCEGLRAMISANKAFLLASLLKSQGCDALAPALLLRAPYKLC